MSCDMTFYACACAYGAGYKSDFIIATGRMNEEKVEEGKGEQISDSPTAAQQYVVVFFEDTSVL